MQEVIYFRIAGHNIRIIFQDSTCVNNGCLNSFMPFKIAGPCSDLLAQIVVDDSLKPIPKKYRKRVRTFDTGNGDTIVDLIDNGGYQYIIKNIEGKECCLLEVNKDFSDCKCALNGTSLMRSYGLNSAIMLVMAFAGASQQTLLMHASTVRCNDKGYAFIAKSGTGKSTQSSMWLRFIPGCDLMNDDNPILRIIDGKAFIFGSPWSGKTPCYRNINAPVGAIVKIERATQNSIEKLDPVEAFAALLPSCSSMKWDADIYNAICDTITKIIETTGIYTLHCLPDKDSALLCHKTIAI